MAYSLFWDSVVHHSPIWLTPPDLWNTFRASQYVVWRGEGQIYNNPAAFQTFPGIAVILMPIAKLSGSLQLTANVGVTLPRPSTWWFLGPTELWLGASLLFPLDDLAKRLSIPSRRRMILTGFEAALVWPTVAMWGHPEDALSLAFAIYALLSAFDAKWLRTSVLFGCAIAIQPLVLLMLPIAIALLPVKYWPRVTSIAIFPSALLLLSPLVQEWGPTTRILLKQPNYVANNHPTPWVSLAPVIQPSHWQLFNSFKQVVQANGQIQNVATVTRARTLPVVAAGPGRIIAIVIACLLGAAVLRLKPKLVHVVWLAALALSLRCLFEPVMVPYYLLPAIAIALVASASSTRNRFIIASVAALVCTRVSYLHLSPWDYFLAFAIPLALLLLVSLPPVFSEMRLKEADQTVRIGDVNH